MLCCMNNEMESYRVCSLIASKWKINTQQKQKNEPLNRILLPECINLIATNATNLKFICVSFARVHSRPNTYTHLQRPLVIRTQYSSNSRNECVQGRRLQTRQYNMFRVKQDKQQHNTSKNYDTTSTAFG